MDSFCFHAVERSISDGMDGMGGMVDMFSFVFGIVEDPIRDFPAVPGNLNS